jgi:hypothetical protein
MNFRLTLLALGVLAVAPRAEATVVLNQTFEEMAVEAHAVVRGKAGPSVARWEDGGRRINTWTEIRVTEVLKGSAGGTVKVRQAGGVIPPVGQTVSGAAEFKEGEDVLLFLEHPGDDSRNYVVVSMAMGKISLERDDFGELRAFRDGRGMGLYEARGGKVKVVEQKEDLGKASAFLARIRKACGVRGGGK